MHIFKNGTILAITFTIYEAFENVNLNNSKAHQLLPLDKFVYLYLKANCLGLFGCVERPFLE